MTFTADKAKQREQNAKELIDAAELSRSNREAQGRADAERKAAVATDWLNSQGRLATHALRCAEYAAADATFALATAQEKVLKAQAALSKLVREGFVDQSAAILQKQEADRVKAQQIQANAQGAAKQASFDKEQWLESLKSRQPVAPAAPGSVLPTDHERCSCGETVPIKSSRHKKLADGTWHVRDIRGCIRSGCSAEWLIMNTDVTVAQLEALSIKVAL